MAFFEVLKQTAAQWTAANPTLTANQIGVESSIVNGVQVDTGKAKLGDGITPWASLSYWSPDGASGSGTVTSVSVTTANGVSGSVATATTTPAISLTLGAITPSSVQVSGLTASEILSTDASKNLTSLAVATYPSLTELSYVKGVTSALQTQINAKGAGTVTSTSVTTANGVSGSVATATTTPAITLTLGAITPTTVNGLTITTSTGTLTVTNGKTASFSNTITFAGTDSTTMTFPPASANIGYLESPINSQSVDYTAVLADSAKTILQTGASKTVTIPANGSVAYPVGTCLSGIFTNATGGSVAITTDTMTLAGTTNTGTRTVAQNGRWTAQKMTSTTWLISGVGVS